MNPQKPSVESEIREYMDLRLDDLLDDVLQGDQPQHLVEGVTFALVVHLLHDGQVGLPCRERTLTLQLAGGLLFSLVSTDKPTTRMDADSCSHDAPCLRRDHS